MPLPSQLASGSHTWRDYLIDFSPTQQDWDYYSTWCTSETPTDSGCLYALVAAEWKISVTPSGNDHMPYIALTCKRAGHYLNGFTLTLKGVGIDHCLPFSAWVVLSIVGLVSDEIDGFLTLGSGWERNEAGNGEKSITDDEIPF